MMIRLLPFLFCALVCFGCSPKGPDVQKVKGVVTLDGAPMDGVTVKFFPVAEGEMGFALTDQNGKYELSMLGAPSQGGVLAGEYSIAFTKMIPDPSFKPKAKPQKTVEGGEEELIEIPSIEVVPKKYTEVSTSGLTVDVGKGGNVHDFDLKSK